MDINGFNQAYHGTIKKFLKSIEGINVEGIPEPHLPCIGEEYQTAKYKLAFYGIETNGWGELSDFIKAGKKGSIHALHRGKNEIDDLNHYYYFRNNFKTTFFDFVLQFLCGFYNIHSVEDLISTPQHVKILKSIIWGNTNSIERFEVSAEEAEVQFENWLKVKEASKIFDTPEPVISFLKPNIIIVMNWNEKEEWLTDVGDIKEPEKLGDHLLYYNKPDTNTHIFWVAHPRWIAINFGFKKFITKIIKHIKQKQIFTILPESYESAFISESQVFDMSEKREYIYKLSKFLTAEKKVMSGRELSEHFNRNNITTEYGTYYAGGRGIYTFISQAYKYFDESGETEKAKSIARAFVKENGDYAYE